VLAAATVLVAVLVVMVSGRESPPPEYTLPRDVPAELEEPLRELHDAVHGEAR
jgi:hypothetical protein